MRRALTEKQRRMAYLLNKDPDFDYSMSDIGQLMKVSQPTISNAVREVAIAREIHGYKKELLETKKELLESKEYQRKSLVQPIKKVK